MRRPRDGELIYHVGYQRANWSKNQEMVVLTQAMYQARELAMARMEEEADELGADGIIGVRLEVNRHTWGESILEFVAIGTAVYHRQGHGCRTPSGKPFTSDLSGQDFWMLLRAAIAPSALVMGNCVYHVAHQRSAAGSSSVGSNVRDAELHAGALRRARARDGAACRTRRSSTARDGRRRHRDPRALARRLGRARHRVLRRRDEPCSNRRGRAPAPAPQLVMTVNE